MQPTVKLSSNSQVNLFNYENSSSSSTDATIEKRDPDLLLIRGDLPSDIFLSKLQSCGVIDQYFYLKNIPQNEMPALEGEALKEINKFLTTPFHFKFKLSVQIQKELKKDLTSARFLQIAERQGKLEKLQQFINYPFLDEKQDYSFEASFPLIELFQNLLKYTGNLKIAGGYAKGLLSQWFLKALNCLNIPDLEKIIPQQTFEKLNQPLEKLIKKIPDKDIRFEAKEIEYELLQILNYEILTFLAKRFCSDESQLEYYRLMLKKTACKIVEMFTQDDIFASTCFWTDEDAIDVLIFKKQKRDHLFSLDAFNISLNQYINHLSSNLKIDLKLTPESSRIDKGWQTIIDILGGIIHIDQPEKIDEKGWPRLMSFLAKSFRLPEKKTDKLLNTILAACSTRKNKDEPAYLDHDKFITKVSKLLLDCHLSHDADDPLALYALVMNAFQSLCNSGISSEIIFKILNKIDSEITQSSNEKETLCRFAFQILKRTSIPFHLFSALLQLAAFLKIHTSEDPASSFLNVYLTLHEAAPALQISDKYSFIVPCKPFDAFQEVLQFLESNPLDEEVHKVLENLLFLLIPQKSYENDSQTQLRRNLKLLNIDMEALEDVAIKALDSPSPLICKLGYHFLLVCHSLKEKTHTTLLILENFPKIVSLENNAELQNQFAESLNHVLKQSQIALGDNSNCLDILKAMTKKGQNPFFQWIKNLAFSDHVGLADLVFKMWKSYSFNSGKKEIGLELIEILSSVHFLQAIRIFRHLQKTNLVNYTEQVQCLQAFIQRCQQYNFTTHIDLLSKGVLNWLLELKKLQIANQKSTAKKNPISSFSKIQTELLWLLEKLFKDSLNENASNIFLIAIEEKILPKSKESALICSLGCYSFLQQEKVLESALFWKQSYLLGVWNLPFRFDEGDLLVQLCEKLIKINKDPHLAEELLKYACQANLKPELKQKINQLVMKKIQEGNFIQGIEQFKGIFTLEQEFQVGIEVLKEKISKNNFHEALLDLGKLCKLKEISIEQIEVLFAIVDDFFTLLIKDTEAVVANRSVLENLFKETKFQILFKHYPQQKIHYLLVFTNMLNRINPDAYRVLCVSWTEAVLKDIAKYNLQNLNDDDINLLRKFLQKFVEEIPIKGKTDLSNFKAVLKTSYPCLISIFKTAKLSNKACALFKEMEIREITCAFSDTTIQEILQTAKQALENCDESADTIEDVHQMLNLLKFYRHEKGSFRDQEIQTYLLLIKNLLKETTLQSRKQFLQFAGNWVERTLKLYNTQKEALLKITYADFLDWAEIFRKNKMYPQAVMIISEICLVGEAQEPMFVEALFSLVENLKDEPPIQAEILLKHNSLFLRHNKELISKTVEILIEKLLQDSHFNIAYQLFKHYEILNSAIFKSLFLSIIKSSDKELKKLLYTFFKEAEAKRILVNPSEDYALCLIHLCQTLTELKSEEVLNLLENAHSMLSSFKDESFVKYKHRILNLLLESAIDLPTEQFPVIVTIINAKREFEEIPKISKKFHEALLKAYLQKKDLASWTVASNYLFGILNDPNSKYSLSFKHSLILILLNVASEMQEEIDNSIELSLSIFSNFFKDCTLNSDLVLSYDDILLILKVFGRSKNPFTNDFAGKLLFSLLSNHFSAFVTEISKLESEKAEIIANLISKLFLNIENHDIGLKNLYHKKLPLILPENYMNELYQKAALTKLEHAYNEGDINQKLEAIFFFKKSRHHLKNFLTQKRCLLNIFKILFSIELSNNCFVFLHNALLFVQNICHSEKENHDLLESYNDFIKIFDIKELNDKDKEIANYSNNSNATTQVFLLSLPKENLYPYLAILFEFILCPPCQSSNPLFEETMLGIAKFILNYLIENYGERSEGLEELIEKILESNLTEPPALMTAYFNFRKKLFQMKVKNKEIKDPKKIFYNQMLLTITEPTIDLETKEKYSLYLTLIQDLVDRKHPYFFKHAIDLYKYCTVDFDQKIVFESYMILLRGLKQLPYFTIKIVAKKEENGQAPSSIYLINLFFYFMRAIKETGSRSKNPSKICELFFKTLIEFHAKNHLFSNIDMLEEILGFLMMACNQTFFFRNYESFAKMLKQTIPLIEQRNFNSPKNLEASVEKYSLNPVFEISNGLSTQEKELYFEVLSEWIGSLIKLDQPFAFDHAFKALTRYYSFEAPSLMESFKLIFNALKKYPFHLSRIAYLNEDILYLPMYKYIKTFVLKQNTYQNYPNLCSMLFMTLVDIYNNSTKLGNAQYDILSDLRDLLEMSAATDSFKKHYKLFDQMLRKLMFLLSEESKYCKSLSTVILERYNLRTLFNIPFELSKEQKILREKTLKEWKTFLSEIEKNLSRFKEFILLQSHIEYLKKEIE